MPKINDNVTLYIVEDDEIICDTLIGLFETIHLKIEIFNTAKLFLEHLDRKTINKGCILLDVRLPDMSGLDVQEALKQRDNRLPIIFITGYGDINTAVKAMKLGAFDFITKPFSNQILLEQVQRAIALNLSNENIERFKENLKKLTARENEILKSIINGKTNKEISYESNISLSTVELHRSNLMKKLKVKNMAQLIRYYLTSCRPHGFL